MTLRRLFILVVTLVAIGAAPVAAAADEIRFGFGGRGARPEDHRGVEAGHRHGPRHDHRFCQYVPGHYEVRTVQVWVPETFREEYVPPVYQTYRDRYGRYVTVMVRPACTNRVYVPGYYDYQTQQVWVPGYWTCGR